jgi:hypothetical protein
MKVINTKVRGGKQALLQVCRRPGGICLYLFSQKITDDLQMCLLCVGENQIKTSCGSAIFSVHRHYQRTSPLFISTILVNRVTVLSLFFSFSHLIRSTTVSGWLLNTTISYNQTRAERESRFRFRKVGIVVFSQPWCLLYQDTMSAYGKN